MYAIRHEEAVAIDGETLEVLITLGFLLLFGSGVSGVLFGVSRAWPKNSQSGWNSMPVLLISVPSALLVSVLVIWFILAIRGLGQLH